MRFFILMAVLMPLNLFAQIDKSAFDEFLTSEAEKWEIPAVSVALVSSDSVLYEFCSGFSDMEKQNPVDKNTCFGLASASKSFTSLLWAMMCSDRDLSADTRVVELMPDFKMSDEYITEHLTIKDLLTHRAGLSRHNVLRDNLSGSREDFMKQMQYLPVTTGFRDRLSYSNLNYMILTGLLEYVTDSTWEEMCQKRIFEPLGMKNTCCNILEFEKRGGDVAVPTITFDDSIGAEALDLHYEYHLAGAGSLVSDLEDMEKWAMYQLSGRTVDDKALLCDRIRARMYHTVIPFYPSRTPETGDESYAQGWFVTHYKGHRHLHHGGVLYGHTSLVSFLPDDDLAVVVLCNQNGATHFTSIISRYLFDVTLGLEPTDWSARFEERFAAYEAYLAQQTEPEIEEIPDENPVKTYLGIYHNKAYGDIEIIRKNEQLMMRLSAYEAELRHITENQYVMVHPVNRGEYPIVFHAGEEMSFTASFERGLDDFEFVKE